MHIVFVVIGSHLTATAGGTLLQDFFEKKRILSIE
jgi:hypothetical protein